ncbi:hypothetical protein ALC57_17444 [Trachymyrmex cornetzi]|uniref:Uncharacterized protein n=1 Tax=Trachymyrmex cornetzi TaxID=471704 RepID=A0A151ITK1_9HYME|nr:hypothetical protein ALC57_17444 [Trachymyrmex cornetzi]
MSDPDLLADQIPSFGGTEDEDVEVKLVKHARDWYDLDDGSVSLSWPEFRSRISARFKRDIPYGITIRKIDERKWNCSKETFHEYSLKKLIAYSITDSTRLRVNIGIESIRCTAPTLLSIPTDEFVTRVSHLTLSTGIAEKKVQPTFTKKDKRDALASSKKPVSEVFCGYCKKRGHNKSECFRWKKREQQSSSQASASSSSEESRSQTSQVGAVIGGPSQQLEISSSLIEINSINGLKCSLNALVDTGSPISLISEFVFRIFFGQSLKNNHADSKLVDYFTDLLKDGSQCDTNREVARQLAIDTTNKIKQYNKIYYDRVHKTPSKYAVGDYVMIRDTSVKPGEDRKFKVPYKGPYLVDKVLNKNRYVIKDIPGFNITQRPYNSILSPDKLKLWVKPVTP